MAPSPISTVTPLPAWADVAAADWRDPAWQLEHGPRSAGCLERVLSLGTDAGARLAAVDAVYPVRVTPYYLSLADPCDPRDPILRQCLPDPMELENEDGLDDPTDEAGDSPVPGLVHRYPDRALLWLTGSCLIHCRHCNRKRLWRRGAGPAPTADRAALEYLREQPAVREVILSGGDPLTLPRERLLGWLDELWEIESVEILRIGTRAPVVLPFAVDDELCTGLSSRGPIWLNTHFNHPREVTAEAAAACERLRRAGVGLSNQSVLLRGVNDDARTLAELNLKLLRIGVRPYYLYHCDPARGVGHFRTSIAHGLEIVERLRGRVSGLAQPLYAADLPGGGGKVHLEPDSLVGHEGRTRLVRDFRGEVREYQDVADPPEDIPSR